MPPALSCLRPGNGASVVSETATGHRWGDRVCSGTADYAGGPMGHPDRSGLPADVIAAYDRVIASVNGAERKGATMPYTSVNGNMSSFLSPDGVLALRLSAEDRVAFIEQFDAALHETHGHVMKEYVAVPPDMLDDTPNLAHWFAASWAYVASLKPKPTTRRKSS
jgi:hypothetical protein